MKLNILTYFFALLFVILISMISTTITTHIFLKYSKQPINDFMLIQEIANRLYIQNGYQKGKYDCVNYAQDLQKIGEYIGIGIHEIDGYYNNGTGHRVNCIEYDAQIQEFANLEAKYDYIKYGE